MSSNAGARPRGSPLSDRVPCCIRGCRRTFRAEVCGGSTEIMCGRHYRCDRVLLAVLKRARARLVKINSKLNRRWRQGTISAELCEKIHTRFLARFNAAWAALKTAAQERQDRGEFAPKPRRKAEEREVSGKPLGDHFERAFQALKRGPR